MLSIRCLEGSIPSFHPLDADINTQAHKHSCLYTVVIIENISHLAKCPLGKGIQNKPGLRNTVEKMLETDRKFHHTHTLTVISRQDHNHVAVELCFFVETPLENTKCLRSQSVLGKHSAKSFTTSFAIH